MKINNVRQDKVKPGDLMAFTYWAKVDDVSYSHLELTNVDNSQEFKVYGKELIETSGSADQYHETAKATKTQVAELLINSRGMPLTVVFTKENGEERTLRGRFLSTESLLGRSYVEDLDIADKNRTRLVDHRSIKSLIVGGIKYVVK